MGYYIKTEKPTGKAIQLLDKYPCTLLIMHDSSGRHWKTGMNRAICHKLMEDFDLVVVVANIGRDFDAAAYAYDKAELDVFMDDEDTRPKWLLVFPKGEAAKLSGYRDAA